MFTEPYIPKPNSMYAYESGVVRGLESKLMSKINFMKLIDVVETEIGPLLTEFGYNGDSYETAELDSKVNWLHDFLEKHNHDPQFIKWFKLRWDFRNAATAVKKAVSEIDFEHEDIIPFGNYKYEDFRRQVNEERNDLPDILKDIMVKAKIDYETHGKVSRIDMICDSSWLNFFYKALPKNNTYLTRYYRVYADSINVPVALRHIELDNPRRDFEEFAIDFGLIPLDFYDKLWESERGSMATLFTHTPYGKHLTDIVTQGLADNNLIELNNFFKEQQHEVLKDSIYSTFGLEVVIAYFEKKRLEIEAIRTILAGKRAGMEQSQMQKAVAYVL